MTIGGLVDWWIGGLVNNWISGLVSRGFAQKSVQRTVLLGWIGGLVDW